MYFANKVMELLNNIKGKVKREYEGKENKNQEKKGIKRR